MAARARKIMVVTGSRAEYGLLYWVAKAIARSESLRIHLVVTGAHLSPEFGLTVRQIEKDGVPIADRVETLISSDTGTGIAKSVGLGVIGMSDVLARVSPDLVVLLGDRFETLASAVATAMMRIPIAHLCGGELTTGSIDDASRHAITKLASIHFPAMDEYARRIVAMGEEPWRVRVVGSPGLEWIARAKLLDRRGLEKKLGIRLTKPVIVATYHPATVEHERTTHAIEALMGALSRVHGTVIFTYPNPDIAAREIISAVRGFVARRANAALLSHMGNLAYLSLLRAADCMVGNSSSGIIEAPSLALPVVNVGPRQDGRVRAANVIDVASSEREIMDGIRRAMDPAFTRGLAGCVNPYGDGRTSDRVVAALKEISLGDRHRLTRKRFYDG